MSTVSALLGGFALGFGAASALCLARRGYELRTRRLALGFAARGLVTALARLEETIETIALDPDLLRKVSGCSDLAAALLRLADV